MFTFYVTYVLDIQCELFLSELVDKTSGGELKSTNMDVRLFSFS